jgi:Fur family ferric uptake transcriptional regulator
LFFGPFDRVNRGLHYGRRRGEWTGEAFKTMADASTPLGNVSVSSTPLERFEEFLQSRGKRMTRPQRLLIEHVFRQHSHFDVDMLLDELPERSNSDHVGRATVYRTLTKFVEAGLLRAFTLDGRTVYEHDYGYPQHDHLHCTECQRLIEFQSDELIRLRDEVAHKANFRVTGHRFIISGICHDCVQAKRRTKRKVDLV